MPQLMDVTGQRFGRLLVIERSSNKSRHVYWRCKCDCGNETTTRIDHLRKGRTVSCGCRRVETNLKHGAIKGNKRRRSYRTWESMKDRCYNENHHMYHRYGGRGIFVCDEWKNSYENFYQDMGEPPYKYTLERIDNNKGYSKENCKWASYLEQGSNRCNNIYIIHNGKTLTGNQWDRKLGRRVGTTWKRVKAGWKHDKAIETSIETSNGIRVKNNPEEFLRPEFLEKKNS